MLAATTPLQLHRQGEHSGVVAILIPAETADCTTIAAILVRPSRDLQIMIVEAGGATNREPPGARALRDQFPATVPAAARPGRRMDRNPMHSVFYHLTTLATLAVLGVLLIGLWNMMRGKSPSLSQMLMRWRVGLQFLAIVIIMVTIYLAR